MNTLDTSIQPNLFDLKPHLPEGFIYESEFLTRREEIELLKYMQTLKFGHLVMHGKASIRGVAGFGIVYSFETGEVSPGKRIPQFLLPLREKVASLMGRDAEEFSEILVTEYPIGAAISWHKDASPFDVVVGVSLLNQCKFKLRRVKDKGWENIDLMVNPRSVYVMNGASRWQWEHSIPRAKALRYSITLRTLRKK